MAFTNDELLTLLDMTSLVHIILDKSGKIHKINRRCKQLFSIPEERIIGTTLTEFMLDEDISTFNHLITSLTQNHPQANETFRFAIMVSKKILSIKFDFSYFDDKVYAFGIDVTEEHAEHDLLSRISKLTRTGAWHYNPDNEFIFFSEECYLLHDLEPGIDITLEQAINYYHPDSRQRVRDSIERLLKTKEIFDYTERLITKKGVEKWVRVIGVPVINKNKVIFVNGSFEDVTERYHTIEKLKQNEETKHLALKGIRSGLFDHLIETNVVFYSKDFRKMLGLPINIDFVPEKEFRKMIHPDDAEEALHRHLSNLEKKGHHYLNHFRLKHLDGGYRHYEVYGYRKKNQKGNTIRMIGNLIDIHQKKINEQLIIENQSRLQAMVNNGFAYTVLLDTKGIILMSDKDSLKIIKRDFNVDPMATPSFFIDVMPLNFKNTFAHEFNEALKGIVVKKEIERITYKGSVQWLESKYTPIFNNQKKINSILVSFHDITERKSAELSIKEAHIKEQELSTLKSNILSNFSHEIRTPLNGIITIANLLLSNEEKPEEREKLLNYLEESKERLLKTINNLSHYSEIDTLKKNLNYVEIDMNYSVETSYREYRHMARSKNLSYLLELDESCPTANIDESIFSSALNNIIHNAIKYTETGEIIVKIKSEKEKIYIYITDTGIGIDKKNIRKIFDPFIQESIGLSRKYEGTGIGLSLSKRYIEILGGKIKIESKVNKGTKFTIILHKNN
ncbi:hypothetical protein GCM10022393_35750 [Aquimarina addita]|uniref:histidine kinase n=1 Tax=Aquimarina addita TaxID=870485 RepID=A0ABP6UQR5_9FLAO